MSSLTTSPRHCLVSIDLIHLNKHYRTDRIFRMIMDQIDLLVIAPDKTALNATLPLAVTLETTTWDTIFQMKASHPVSDPQVHLIFTSLSAMMSSTNEFQDRLIEEFGIPRLLLSKTCLQSNGYSGGKAALHVNGTLEYYNHWSRFIIKQTYDSLRPKPSFVQHPASSKGDERIDRFRVPNAALPIHNLRSVPYGWEWYEVGFFVHWAPPLKTTVLCFDLPHRVQVSVRSMLESSKDKIEFFNPYSVFEILVDEVIGLYDDSVWSIRNHVSHWEAERHQEHDYPLLHEILRHAIHVSETLAASVESVKNLQEQHHSFMTVHGQKNDYLDRTQRPFQFQLQILHGLLLRSESNKSRIENEAMLAFHTAAQRDSKIQIQMAENAEREARTMKAIAVVTMTFLPATFLCSVFGMSFFHFEPPQDGKKETFSVSNRFWLFWVLATPLSVMTFLLWMFWDKKRR